MIDDWITELSSQGKSENTLKMYKTGVEHFIKWSEATYGQQFTPAAIIPRDVSDWKTHQQVVERAAISTINQRLAALSKFFKWAISTGLAKIDPTASIRSIRPEKRRPKALDDRATRRLLREVHQHGDGRDIALVELLLGAGLRISEALNLQNDDLVMNERSGYAVIRHTKGGQSRTVPLTLPVRKALQAYLSINPPLPNAPVWNGRRGPLKDPAGVWKLLKEYARQAGLDPDLVSPHILRHTFATRYLAANPGDLRGLAAILGHSSLDTVMIYTEPTTEALAERMERAETTK